MTRQWTLFRATIAPECTNPAPHRKGAGSGEIAPATCGHVAGSLGGRRLHRAGATPARLGHFLRRIGTCLNARRLLGSSRRAQRGRQAIDVEARLLDRFLARLAGPATRRRGLARNRRLGKRDGGGRDRLALDARLATVAIGLAVATLTRTIVTLRAILPLTTLDRAIFAGTIVAGTIFAGTIFAGTFIALPSFARAILALSIFTLPIIPRAIVTGAVVATGGPIALARAHLLLDPDLLALVAEVVAVIVLVEIVAQATRHRLIVGPATLIGKDAEIMIRELEIIFGVHTITGHLRITRHVAIFFV